MREKERKRGSKGGKENLMKRFEENNITKAFLLFS